MSCLHILSKDNILVITLAKARCFAAPVLAHVKPGIGTPSGVPIYAGDSSKINPSIYKRFMRYARYKIDTLIGDLK